MNLLGPITKPIAMAAAIIDNPIVLSFIVVEEAI